MTTQHIQLRRGTAADLPDAGIEGEPRFTTDTGLLYVDDGTNNILIGGPGGIYTGSFTRDVAGTSGDVSYTGVGFKPSLIVFYGMVDNVCFSFGNDNGTVQVSQYFIMGATLGFANSAYRSILLAVSSGNEQNAFVKSFNADGFTLTWTKAGSPTGTATIIYLAFR